MLNTPWLNSIIFIIITMPGALIYLFKEISYFRYKSFGTVYLYILFFFEIILGPTINKYYAILVLAVLMVGAVLPLIIELNIWKPKEINRKIIRIVSKNQSLFLFPVLEELHFRWLIFMVGQLIGITPFAYVLISGMSFGIAHIPYLGIKSLYKVIQGIILAIIYIQIGLPMTILCHLLFNVFVFVYRMDH